MAKAHKANRAFHGGCGSCEIDELMILVVTLTVVNSFRGSSFSVKSATLPLF
ncbi:hypothetical protein IG631_05913 [Alternaria alternata]|nr:hypothetical protein IG631_05913 [Alternaria alternata]